MPTVDGELVVGDDGIPPLLVAVVPRDEIEFTDGWHVQGLKGTGSYDYNVDRRLRPGDRTFELFTRTPAAGRLAGLPHGADPDHRAPGTPRGPWAWPRACSTTSPSWPWSRCAWATTAPWPTGPPSRRASSHHTAMWRAARLLVIDTFGHVERTVLDGGELTPGMRADLRMAATYATEASREMVPVGPSGRWHAAIREGSRLERAFRDLYTGDPARVHRREDLHRRGAHPPRPGRGPARPLTVVRQRDRRRGQSCSDFTSRNSSRPKEPNSRPLPDCL